MPSSRCEICYKVFCREDYFHKHVARCYQKTYKNTGYPFEKFLFKCFEGCRISFKTNMDLRQHLTNLHEFKFRSKNFEFDSFEDFQTWLKLEEKTDNIKYSKRNGIYKTRSSTEKIRFDCSRTGKRRVIPDQLLRQERCKSSCKYDIGCTSQIVLTRHTVSGKCAVVYYSTHYGHDRDTEMTLNILTANSVTCVLDTQQDAMQLENQLSDECKIEGPCKTTLINDVQAEALKLVSTLKSCHYSQEELQHLLENLKSLNKLGTALPKDATEIHLPRNSHIKIISIKKSVNPNTFSPKRLISGSSDETESLSNIPPENLFISNDTKYDHLYC